MRSGVFLAASGVCLFAALQGASAQTPDLRAQIVTFIQTTPELKIPANVDRTCVVDRAVAQYPKEARTVDGRMRFLPKPKAPKDRKSFDEGMGELKIIFAVFRGIRDCTPKPVSKR